MSTDDQPGPVQGAARRVRPAPGCRNRAAMISVRSCDFTAAADRWASTEFSQDSSPRATNTATSGQIVAVTADRSRRANVPAIAVASSQACPTITAAVTVPTAMPASR